MQNYTHEYTQIRNINLNNKNLTGNIIYLGAVVLFLVVLYQYIFKSIIKKYTSDKKNGYLKDRKELNKRLDNLILDGYEKEKKDQKVKPFAFIIIDIDNFRHVKDQLGYSIGDELIELFSERLYKYSKEKFEAFCLGGNEFAIIYTDLTTKKKLEKELKKMYDYMLEPYMVTEEKIKITLEYSVGVSIFPMDAKTKEELFSCSDIAVEGAKENGKNCICFNSPLLIKKAENKYKMEQSIKSSFKNGDFEVDFQPRFGLKERNKLWLVSFVYWNHPSLGKLKAEYFIKYIEELGFITKIDELTLAKTCAKLKYFDEQGIEDVNIAVNLSFNQLKRKDFVDRICDILGEYKKYSNKITLEINNLLDKNDLELYKTMFEKLKLCGVNIAINNFEIIYDGISAIKQLPVDELKINCDFLKQELFSKDVLKYIVKIAKTLEYQTTLIGIETKEQYDFANQIGVDKVQGNYISKVIDPENMLENIRKYTKMKK